MREEWKEGRVIPNLSERYSTKTQNKLRRRLGRMQGTLWKEKGLEGSTSGTQAYFGGGCG